MFKANSSGSAQKGGDYNTPDRLNRIVEGTKIKGDITSDSNLRIDGIVIGTVSVKGRLVIGSTGRIEGNVTCQNADIEGIIDGSVFVEDLLSLKSTAKLNGEMTTGKLHIEPGADFTGSCKMGNNKSFSLKSKDKSNITVEDILEEHN